MPRFSVADISRFIICTLLLAAAMLQGCSGHAPAAQSKRCDSIIELLDDALHQRATLIARKQGYIDSLRHALDNSHSDLATLEKLGTAYSTFNNDSAIIIFNTAWRRALNAGNRPMAMRFNLLEIPQLPLGGFIPEAIERYNQIDTTACDSATLMLYHDVGRQMYSHIGAFYIDFPYRRQHYDSLSRTCQNRLIDLLDRQSVQYKLNAGEALYHRRELDAAESLLRQITDSNLMQDNSYARAAHILSDISLERHDNESYFYYLALSALADTRSSTLEVTSLQELGMLLYSIGDVERAHTFLNAALESAVACHAETRMLQTAKALPVIESVHRRRIEQSRHAMVAAIAVLVPVVIALLVALFMYRRQIEKRRRLQTHLEEANRIKETYISQFLDLCSVYMDKLNQFCKIANRKISAGKVDELYKLTSSGKLIENQSREFYSVFDNAFLHICPDFVTNVNRLMQPEHQFELRDPATLNTDLRILALMRLGIFDSGRIAQTLNYSINTIYTYRNKLKNYAINRDTFEEDIRSC